MLLFYSQINMASFFYEKKFLERKNNYVSSSSISVVDIKPFKLSCNSFIAMLWCCIKVDALSSEI